MSRSILLFTLVCTLLSAQQENEAFPFVGTALTAHSIDLNSDTRTSGENETVLGIRYGQQTLDWRTMFTYSGNSALQSFSVEIDKILLDELFGTPKVRPYLGATVGYLHYDKDAVSDNSGYFYGGNLGFLLYATDRIDVDLSYHYYDVSGLDQIKSMQGANLSLHYFF